MSRRKDKQVEQAYKNLQKLGPWGEESIIYSLFTTDEGFKKTTNSKQFKSAQISPRKTFSKEIATPALHSGHSTPQRVFTGRPMHRGPKHELPRTNVQEYFNKKPDKRMTSTTKKLYPSRSVSKSLPLLNVKKQLEIERKIFVMQNRQVQAKWKTQYGGFREPEKRERRNTVAEPQHTVTPTERVVERPGFKRHFEKVLKILDQINKDDPLWVDRRNVPTNVQN